MALARAAAGGSADAGAPAADPLREFAFSKGDFEFLAGLAYKHAGISLSDSKRNLVYSRLSRRLRALGLSSFGEYRQYLESSGGDEVERFINSISTNHTQFFREAHHFTHFRKAVHEIFAEQDQKRSPRRLRVWSAGCSTGEEPYTIALVLRRELPEIARHDVKILATDIDTDVLAKASRGEYPAESLDNVPDAFCRYFQPVPGSDGATLKVAHDVRALITFRQLNLMSHWPMKGPFDAIFCRNVMIYFDAPTKSKLIDRLVRLIRPGGMLYIGHSESLLGTHAGLRLMGRTIYRRDA
ncbi:MAG TPA: protein-glutamate O-methyltransferase CheR [Xanthobacteraceae bacterium]|jgi:chemotaxis protein methyltransferase CheR|nr:protein-glutamate O-methyltransferase CheR [Xanthobacteraceae bacterium]